MKGKKERRQVTLKGRKIKLILIPVVLFSLSLFLVTPDPSLGDSLPQSIGSLPLERRTSGEQARKEIDRLHGKKLDFLKAYIGTYGEGNEKAKLWVSEYDSEAEAAEEVEKMARGMKAKEQKNFWHYREIPVEGVTVYFVVGMGQAHYFFQRGVKVVWLAVDPSMAKQAIRDVIKQIP